MFFIGLTNVFLGFLSNGIEAVLIVAAIVAFGCVINHIANKLL